MQGKIERYYASFDEWSRLDTPAGQLEFERTLAQIDRILIGQHHVLDLGGGPGRYSIALAQRGHTVCLADLSKELLAVAKEKITQANVADRVSSIVQLNATDLSQFDQSSFDAALAFGPFYHLVNPAERKKAALELYRVLRPGGRAIVAFIPRLTGLAGILERAAGSPSQVPPEVVDRVVNDGVFLNPTPSGFQNGYYPHPHELVELFQDAGFKKLDLLSVRGLYAGREQAYQAIRDRSPDTASAFDRMSESHARDPAVVSLGGHALLVLERPKTPPIGPSQ